MTTLHPAAICVLSMLGWRLRVWLAVVIAVALMGLPPPFAGLALWLAGLSYIVMTEILVRMFVEQQGFRRQLEQDNAGHAVALAQRDARITVLEADLAQARSTSASSEDIEGIDAKLYLQVGLHPRAPSFLVAAARRAFRVALHPDRHPRHLRQAHERYVKAEAVFDRIYKARA